MDKKSASLAHQGRYGIVIALTVVEPKCHRYSTTASLAEHLKSEDNNTRRLQCAPKGYKTNIREQTYACHRQDRAFH